METIKHKFRSYQTNENIETLIIGTFNPDAEKNEANFFYSRKRNHLWKLLPLSYSEESLKDNSRDSKQQFINKHKIGFVDLIAEVKVDEGQDVNYLDSYIDGKVEKWTDVINLIQSRPRIKKVCFTRKTLNGIPNLREKIEIVKNYCDKQHIHFEYMETPARYFSENKLTKWKDFLLNDN